jgi:hypothetical protein
MANPNIVAVSSILGVTAQVNLTSTSATSVLSNASGSGRVYKVETLMVANVDGTNAVDITINRYSAAALGGTPLAICSTVSVPADSTLVVIDKSNSFYLTEDSSIGATAGAANDAVVTISYEDIS